MLYTRLLQLLPLLSLTWAPAWADSQLSISLKHDSIAEQQTRAQLERIIEQHNLVPYLFTHAVVVDQDAIPHSDPVLTLNTRFLRYDDRLMAAFMHEELHWFVDQHEGAELQAEREYRALYPKVPVGFPEGAQDEESTYLHLTVCYLEYQTMKKLVGQERAEATVEFLTKDHYTWVYKTVLADENKIGAIVARHGLQRPELGTSSP